MGYKRDLSHPVIWLWNDDHHVGDVIRSDGSKVKKVTSERILR